MSSSKSGFDTVPVFDGSNWLSWSARMSQFLMAQKLWPYVAGTISKPALIATSSTDCMATSASVKDRDAWVLEDSSALGYLKIKCTESVVAGIPADQATSKEVWDGLKEKYDKASAAVVLSEIRSAFGFRISGADPLPEVQKLAAMFQRLAQRGFSIPEFVRASILLMAMPSKWDQLATYLLQSNALDKLDWDIVSEAIVSEHARLKGSNRPPQSAEKLPDVKRKQDHPPTWKGKSRDDQPAASGSGSGGQKEKKKGGRPRSGKQVKECREAAKQRAHMAEQAMAIDPPVASTSALPAPPPVVTTVNGNGIVSSAPAAFIPKKLPASIMAKPISKRFTGSSEVRPGVWRNAEKASDLSDRPELPPKVQALKGLGAQV